jgi:hypothetical protein
MKKTIVKKDAKANLSNGYDIIEVKSECFGDGLILRYISIKNTIKRLKQEIKYLESLLEEMRNI